MLDRLREWGFRMHSLKREKAFFSVKSFADIYKEIWNRLRILDKTFVTQYFFNDGPWKWPTSRNNRIEGNTMINV